MTTTILLSGPSTSSNQLRTALAGAGFSGVAETTSHGHEDGHETRWTGDRYEEDVWEFPDDEQCPEVEPIHRAGDIIPGTGVIEAIEPDHPIAWVHCLGDIAQAQDVAGGFGWRLRAHWEQAEEAVAFEPFNADALTPGERLIRVERDLLILKGGEGRGG